MSYLHVGLAAWLALLCTPAAAHDYWIERVGDDYALYQGHVHSAHKGEDRVPYDPAIVKRVACLRPEGDLAAPGPGRTYPVRVSARCAAVLIDASSGYWTQTLAETVQKRKTEVRGALRGWLAEESIKRIDAWTPRVAQPIADGFELVPLENPLALKPGDKLRVAATWRGQPRRGVALAYDGDARGVTGADGQANIRIRRGGVQMLSASFEETAQEPNADKIIRGTILQFELPR